ncbi:superoxide dismutase [Mn] 1 [Abditibacteriota bacterium]|nr:superoxide dismutase [Mn] 1 [Abditibacteriota bacterium]
MSFCPESKEEMRLSRRSLLQWAVAVPAALAVSRVVAEVPFAEAAPAGPFKLPPLAYPYASLGPTISEMTMRIHHDKHHQAYVDKLNAAVAATPSLAGKSAQTLIQNLDAVPESVRTAVRNNGGGHVNHTMYWEIMNPKGGGAPKGDIAAAIRTNFGSFDNFVKKFDEAGEKRFGSGWVWLAMDKGKMKILSTPNQDNPLMMGMMPIFGNDVWEHAYYLTYQNRRGEYLKAWWHVVNWDAVNARLHYFAKNA